MRLLLGAAILPRGAIGGGGVGEKVGVLDQPIVLLLRQRLAHPMLIKEAVGVVGEIEIAPSLVARTVDEVALIGHLSTPHAEVDHGQVRLEARAPA